MRLIRRWLSAALDRADYVTPVDRAIREEGERLRKAFPWLDERRRRN
jgi:hypothetical protein